MSKPKTSRVEVERSSALSNSQACSPSPHQAASRAARSPALGRRAPTEQLAQIAQPAMLARLGEIGVDGVGDDRAVLGVSALALRRQQSRQPLDQEGAVAAGVGAAAAD